MSLQLKQLEKDRLIIRKVYTKKPPLKVGYSLTAFGKTVVPLLQLIIEWGIMATLENGEFIEREKP